MNPSRCPSRPAASIPERTPGIPAATTAELAVAKAVALLVGRGRQVQEVPGAEAPGMWAAAVATALMDEYRRSGSAEVFEQLIQLTAQQLFARVRMRLRFFGSHLDPHEVLQDAIINIYRYPDRFAASRPGAFAAWSSTIVDNTIRRQLRRQHTGIDLALSPAEVLSQQADVHQLEPSRQAQDHEECALTIGAYRLLLQFYLAAFYRLSERERFVLQMVEIRQMRYAELAAVLGIRPEALKMVVFRARRRIFDHLGRWFAAHAAGEPMSAAG